MTQAAQRMPLIDALKAVAALLVLLNHFSSYGPLAADLRAALPGLFDWFYEYGRMAVQIFLVIAGFLAARALSPRGEALAASPLPLIGKRYLRLVIPFLAALGLAIAAAAIADHWMDDEAIPDRATFAQWLAHALLLHGLLGVEALSAGVWYIAIDFQLFALMALLLWSGRDRRLAPLLVLATAVASLFWFNRDASWDNWALYFFGSYGLGAAAWWAADRRRLAAWLGVIATVVIAALIVDFRLRILLALAVALLLGFAQRNGLLARWPDARPLAFLGKISYSLFLVHFPVLLLANGLYAQSGLDSPFSALSSLSLAIGASLAVATLFHRWIESPEASRRITGALGWLLGQGLATLRRLPGVSALLAFFARRA
ncbi:MAG: acyltransferase [Dechloromonas sp.]|nr:MAG: acyltransferase [Dechloromonas sp.]